jgi:A/G-specific adenine glycosylase
MDKKTKILIDWYIVSRRDLPWRHTKEPYLIWLSEIILQQTRVEQGKPYYLAFVDNFPTVNELASADLNEVLKLWQGLGYYSRARNLHFTAQDIVNNMKGEFPRSYKGLLKLKGVGDYTASAIASFSYKEVVPVLDGNVYRFISRLYGISTEINTPKANKEFKEVLYELIDKNNPDIFNQSIMEFGALNCTPKKPLCDSCVFNDSCYALSHNKVFDFPVKAKSKKSINRYFNYLIYVNEGKIYIKKRIKKDIWSNLYEFPMIESEEVYLSEKVNATDTLNVSVSYKHILSHQNIFAKFYIVNSIPEELKNQDEIIEVALGDLEKYPIHRLLDKFLKETDWIKI